ncbi:thermonuclease family protein [Enterovirga aerilata]|uniref:DNA-binding protein n=1 Tax=Enterovirga aerilata TaxID=2730920 RepID=A0A849IAF7_9HYPH|nr:thermonuclease family protein [Enterovirga sp. DB1703]NNM74378.1 DNA-binding protein [Enterovirga sp. DB1703]
MNARLAASLLLLSLAAGSAEAEDRPAFTCSETVSAQILDRVSDGEFRLAGGGSARLADIRLAPDGEAARRAAAWLGTLGGSRIQMRELAPPDRWGRAAAHLALAGTPPIDIGELLVSEGLAVVDPGQRDLLCRRELLRAEERARRSRIGLWRDGPWPIAASALDDLARAAGSFVVVEGRIASVGERRERTYLNFGRDWARDFNVTIPRRSWEALKAKGITAASLTGAVVRVRGLLEVRRAPTLDLAVPDVLEIISARTGRSGGG